MAHDRRHYPPLVGFISSLGSSFECLEAATRTSCGVLSPCSGSGGSNAAATTTAACRCWPASNSRSSNSDLLLLLLPLPPPLVVLLLLLLVLLLLWVVGVPLVPLPWSVIPCALWHSTKNTLWAMGISDADSRETVLCVSEWACPVSVVVGGPERHHFTAKMSWPAAPAAALAAVRHER